MLRLRYRHAVTGDNHNVFSIQQQLGGIVSANRNNIACYFSGRAVSTRTKTARDDADKVPVHGAAHNVAQNSAAATNQCAGND